MTSILSFLGHVAPRAATDHASAAYIVQSVFDYPTLLSGSPVHPASVSPCHSSDGVHSTTNSGVSGGRGVERMREGALRIDGTARSMRAAEIDGAGEDATASSLHPRLLDQDSGAGGDAYARSSCREMSNAHRARACRAHATPTPVHAWLNAPFTNITGCSFCILSLCTLQVRSVGEVLGRQHNTCNHFRKLARATCGASTRTGAVFRVFTDG